MIIKNITIFGSGLMGAGIAQTAANAGYKVVLSDLTESALNNGLGMISSSLKRLNKSNQSYDPSVVMNRITTTTDLPSAVKGSDLILEAIVENLKVKQDLWKQIERLSSGRETIFGTNTSSLSVASISSVMTAASRARFAGLHFFNPVPQMKLVELISTQETSSATTQALAELCQKMEKTVITCADTPGFIVNRLLIPFLLESLQILERGHATVENVDAGMKLGAGHPMGPFELADYIGLDTVSHILSSWRDVGEKFPTSPLLEAMVRNGLLGRKSKIGFYKYDERSRKTGINEDIQNFLLPSSKL